MSEDDPVCEECGKCSEGGYCSECMEDLCPDCGRFTSMICALCMEDMED